MLCPVGAFGAGVLSFLRNIKPNSLLAYVAAAVIVGVAAFVRWGIGFVVYQTLPFITFYPTVVLVTFFGGAGPGAFAVAAGAVVAWWAFMPHSGNVLPSDLGSQITLALFLLFSLGMVWGTDYTRRLAKRLRDEEGLRALAVQELGHRLKNKVMTIQAIIRMCLQGHPEASDKIQGALTALANADGLLAESQGNGASLRALLLAEVAPYNVERAALAGPDVLLPAQLVLTMALLIHELATNAAKYGAFSKTEGRVSVEWSLNQGCLELAWRESDGPTIARPTSSGFGTRLFKRALEPLGGTVHVDFAPTGLVCKLSIPMSVPLEKSAANLVGAASQRTAS